MDFFSTVEVEIFVIYMYFTVSLISKTMHFVPQLQFPVPVTWLAENTVTRMLKFASVIDNDYFWWSRNLRHSIKKETL